MTIRELFASDIDRRIEEVIKVDQTDDEILRGEIDEYVVTDAIREHYTGILHAYQEAPNNPHEGIGIWISGFFGSGKSSFAKILGLAIENRQVIGQSAAARFAQRVTGDGGRLDVLLRTINEKIPTHAVIFDVSTHKGIHGSSQALSQIMYRLFLQSLGYAKDLDLAELEITLEQKGELARFEDEYERLFDKKWANEKDMVVFALSEASQVLHTMHPLTYPAADSWVRAVKNRADITPAILAERATELMRRRKPEHALLFVIDEVGQFVARDGQKIRDLKAVVESLGRIGRGKHWVAVTSQEQLGDLVSGLDDRQIELAWLMDRFKLQVHLEQSDISEVTSKRVLAKNATAQDRLGRLFDEHRARLVSNTQLSAEIRLPELKRESFIDLYPLLPYQIDLVIQVVSGLRTRSGGTRHVGGANRTIIKLAQQLLINKTVDLASAPVGTLARLDHVYDLVENNISSDIRAKISAISRELTHPLAQRVAKVICLLQYVRSVPRSEENIAAALVENVAGDSPIAQVREALAELVRTHKIRLGDGGYRIPTPAEDDWERIRNGISPRGGDTNRIYAEVLTGFWAPQPTHLLADVKAFKAGLHMNGREHVHGDIAFHFSLADQGEPFTSADTQARARSQQNPMEVCWAVALTRAIDDEQVQLFRSREMLQHKERDTKGEDTPGLMAEERARLNNHQENLRKLLRDACLTGRVYFRGNDRTPGENITEVRRAAEEILRDGLPQIFDRFGEAAAKVTDARKGVETLVKAHNLQGLTPIFSQLRLVRSEAGKTVFAAEGGPLQEVLRRITDRADSGDNPNGAYLEGIFAKPPFGWDSDVVRLLVVSLMRAELVEATSKGHRLDSVTTSEAGQTLTNANLFRQATFRPRRGVEPADRVRAGDAFRDTFGREVADISSSATIAEELRQELARQEDALIEARDILRLHRLPGADGLDEVLGHFRTIRSGSVENAITTFNASHRTIKDVIRRAAELRKALTQSTLDELARARRTSEVIWPELQAEPDLDAELEPHATELSHLLRIDDFYRNLSGIAEHSQALEAERQRRFDDAERDRVAAFTIGFEQLTTEPGWDALADEDRRDIAAQMIDGQQPRPATTSLTQLRSERDAAPARLQAAVRRLRQLVEGDRIATIEIRAYFGRGIETVEELDVALADLRDECERLIAAGKKVVLP